MLKALVWAGMVIVDEELLEHGLEVAGAEDEQVVQDLSTGGADEAFADRVCPRRLIGELQDCDTLGAEDLIEAGRKLGVSIRSR